MTRTRVLVADDLSSVSNAVAALMPESFDVVGMVSDGRTALETTLSLKPDVVILDISMPEMNGIEVARELRKQHSKTKIVFLTVYILASCLAAGGLGYVVKLLMDSDLIPAMNEALAGRVFISRLSYRQETP